MRQFTHQGGDGKDLVAACQLWFLEQIDDLDVILSGQVLLTDFFEVGKGSDTLRGLSSYIQPQFLGLFGLVRSSAWRRFFQVRSPSSFGENRSVHSRQLLG